jgi:hypothetical protein
VTGRAPSVELRPADVSASGLGFADLCPAAYALPVAHAPGADRPAPRAGDDGVDADRGTYLHKVWELRILGRPRAEALEAGAKAIAPRRVHHTWRAWAQSHEPADLLPSGYRWTPERRWEIRLGPLTVGGTPDVVGVRGLRGESVYIPDWKSTRPKPVDDSLPAAWALAFATLAEQKAHKHSLQMAFHSVAALETMPQALEVTTDLVYLGPPPAKGEHGQVLGEKRAHLRREGLPEARRRLELITERVAEARALPDPQEAAMPGLYCRYCPAAGGCLRAGEVRAPWAR